MPWEWELSPTAEQVLAQLDLGLKGAFNQRMGELMRDPTPSNPLVVSMSRTGYPTDTLGYHAYPFWITFRLVGDIVQVGTLVHNPRDF
ncbi:MAG: hypothetical protein F4Y94_04630 [Chloroflexi bacterium]|nr:hypothetical protein [Chloroflexota bacterium]